MKMSITTDCNDLQTIFDLNVTECGTKTRKNEQEHVYQCDNTLQQFGRIIY